MPQGFGDDVEVTASFGSKFFGVLASLGCKSFGVAASFGCKSFGVATRLGCKSFGVPASFAMRGGVLLPDCLDELL